LLFIFLIPSKSRSKGAPLNFPGRKKRDTPRHLSDVHRHRHSTPSGHIRFQRGLGGAFLFLFLSGVENPPKTKLYFNHSRCGDLLLHNQQRTLGGAGIGYGHMFSFCLLPGKGKRSSQHSGFLRPFNPVILPPEPIRRWFSTLLRCYRGNPASHRKSQKLAFSVS